MRRVGAIYFRLTALAAVVLSETHCPTTIPASALSRLDTIQARLDSTWRATLSIQVALANFETELNDAQKIRFNAMNFAARESAQPVQRNAGSGTNRQSP